MVNSSREMFNLAEQILMHARSLLLIAERTENQQERQQIASAIQNIIDSAVSLSDTARGMAGASHG